MVNKYTKNIIVIFLISLIILALINLNIPSIKERMIDYTKDQLGLSNSPVNSTYIYKGHFLIAKDLFKENPFLGVRPNYIQHCNNNEKFQSHLTFVLLIHTILTFSYLLKLVS